MIMTIIKFDENPIIFKQVITHKVKNRQLETRETIYSYSNLDL